MNASRDSLFAVRWSLNITEAVDYESVHCLRYVRSQIYGDAVLKIHRSDHEFPTELSCLQAYEGHGLWRLGAHGSCYICKTRGIKPA